MLNMSITLFLFVNLCPFKLILWFFYSFEKLKKKKGKKRSGKNGIDKNTFFGQKIIYQWQFMIVKGLLIVFYTMGKSLDLYKKEKRKNNLLLFGFWYLKVFILILTSCFPIYRPYSYFSLIPDCNLSRGLLYTDEDLRIFENVKAIIFQSVFTKKYIKIIYF